PLVDTSPTFERLFRKDILRYPLEFWARARFAKVESLYPGIFEWSQGIGLIGRLLNISKNEFKMPDSRQWNVKIPTFMQENSDFDFLHSLSGWDPKLRNPIQIWSTAQDRIVAADINSSVLPDVDPLMISQGHHCSFPIHWHPHVTQALFDAHIIRSANVGFALKYRYFRANEAPDWKFKDVISLDNKNIELIFNSPSIKQTISLTMSPADFDFNFAGRDVGEWEIKLLKRWLSTHLNVVGYQNSQVTVTWPSVKSKGGGQ
ncbi:MAG: hypothetical protein ACK5V3_02350, partial [Bdellovibrionales bacterium]